jgi:predicted RNase H-like nuclease (RuvC/YqgF family)
MPPNPTIAIAAEAAKSQDPIFIGLAFVLGVVILLVAIGKPMMSLVREYKKTGAEGAKSSAETSLFDTLQHQIRFNSEAIEKLVSERNTLFERCMGLEREIDRLKVFEESVTAMKLRLDEKDRIIEVREQEIRSLTRSILEMKDRIHALEIRNVKSEQQQCLTCPYRELFDEKIKNALPEEDQT